MFLDVRYRVMSVTHFIGGANIPPLNAVILGPLEPKDTRSLKIRATNFVGA